MRDDTSLIGHTFYHKIKIAEVKKALTRMKTGKAMEPNEIPT